MSHHPPSSTIFSGIELRNATVAFRSNQSDSKPFLALKSINLKIAYGEFIVIVGRNGSGKSTLAQVLAGLLPLSAGSISVSPRGPQSETPIIQLVFQNADAQIVGETVYEDLCFGLENFCCPNAEIEGRAVAALTQVGLEDFRDVSITALSGGQKSLLCIASALAVDAQVVIFDEATAMLDGKSRNHILGLAHQLNQQGLTVIWVTQLMEEVTAAKRVIALDAGRIRFQGLPREFFYEDNRGDHDDDESHHIAPGIQSHRTPSSSSPCRELQFEAPYTVQVTQELLRHGLCLTTLPLTPEQLAREVRRLWH